ncbi:peptide-methionine (S)-S-oxide reductase MsrA [Candidatus Pelagibacter sp.]|jgi:methionine-S-sulfoxide reductase|nr:peptide-methionine (S)-S-oxide reductase MsrA [Candidatus Pelagibacter sp.]
MWSNIGQTQNVKTAYFAGGCFWCMEEAFENVKGVLDVVSGYSGGTTKNPTYKEVVKGKTGHFEAIEVRYDSDKIKYKDLLENFWINIDPFDADGQFCDKGYSYKSVAFYLSDTEKNLITNSIKSLEKKFNKKIVTYIIKFEKFYKAEEYHQDYYVKNFINYLRYKKGCRRVKTLEKIWN